MCCAVLICYPVLYHRSGFWGRQETLARGLYQNKWAACWDSQRGACVHAPAPMRACAAQREMGCRGVLKNNRSHFRLDHFPLKRMLIPAATINATRPAPSVIIRAKSTKSCSFCSGGKARENFSFLLHIIFVVVFFFFQKMPVCGEIFFSFFFSPFFLCLTGKTQ